MFDVKKLMVPAVVGMALGAAAPANALSISVQTFSAPAYSSVIGTFASFDSEDFEALGASECGGAVQCEIASAPLGTSVGDFSALGGTGGGNTVVGTGTEVALKSDLSPKPGGRANTTPGGAWWLDSNDTIGMEWDVARDSGGTFNRLAFVLTDPADVGATLEVVANGSTLTSFANENNATQDLIVITFDSQVASANIKLRNDRNNDGIGVDDAAVGVVPLPAAGLMLLGALGGLGGIAARRKRKSA